MDLMGMVGVGPAGPRGGAPHRRPQAAAAARRAAPCGPGLVACRGGPRRRGRAAGRAVRQDGPGGRSPSAPAKPGRLRPVARLMLKCAEDRELLPESKFGAGMVPSRGTVWYNGVEKCGGADAAARFGAKAESLLWRLGFFAPARCRRERNGA